MERTVWVGFVDGKVHRSDDPDYEGVQNLAVFPHKIDAQTCYQDVRKAKLVIEQPATSKGHSQ